LKSEDELYRYKNIIVPIPKEVLKESQNVKNEENQQEEKVKINNEEQINNNEKQEKESMQLVKYKESLWEKIKRRFKFWKN